MSEANSSLQSLEGLLQPLGSSVARLRSLGLPLGHDRAHMVQYESQLKTLRELHVAQGRLLDKLHNAAAPINRLPAEILVHIFSNLLQERRIDSTHDFADRWSFLAFDPRPIRPALEPKRPAHGIVDLVEIHTGDVPQLHTSRFSDHSAAHTYP
ncbi:hypothetical protein OH76DRAFT_1487743 [Lentinus brumalis]|uniref:F-box domain-containing protein n=1 Tax=Lentinus brumalis TaxID=2498619 RepID=A0A371CTI3_9APHY|nr:hypothetical protein OH76DRAFT_1487743 [Polyporus brumalis]